MHQTRLPNEIKSMFIGADVLIFDTIFEAQPYRQIHTYLYPNHDNRFWYSIKCLKEAIMDENIKKNPQSNFG